MLPSDQMTFRPVPYWKQPSPWYWVILGVVVIVFIVVVFSINVQFAEEYARLNTFTPISRRDLGSVLVTIHFGDAGVRAFKGRPSPDLTIESALYQIADVAGLPLRLTGNEVRSFGGLASKKGGPQWNIYVNGEKMAPPSLGVSIQRNDKVTLKYE
ncbi:MAG: hypothetical protein HY220_01680 [Candidatus Sungbacteria bacterium]|uniref:DUF4430 domain-containing protein n=1 Tax=Candidatus Sungiibacteriota bacterium TaxID=2750080 RepID=A0A9D6QTZ5_9BACT|nr:hypothetical protein [Candidatus Sungbacteria bacterium]